jgi:murein L,D-transpeptidase YafK
MTDDRSREILRHPSFGSQRAFQIQAFPFKMTPLNMAKTATRRHGTWRMIKQGYDHFEVTRQEPKVDVCEKRYVRRNDGKFTPAGKCPVSVSEDLVAAVKEKQQRDDTRWPSSSAAARRPSIRTRLDGVRSSRPP